MKTLHLTLKKKPFDVMVTGEKRNEFRIDGEWIRRRILTQNGSRKEYDNVKFVNGYGNDRPYFIAKYLGFDFYDGRPIQTVFSNGLEVDLKMRMIVIKLGDIIEKGNL